MKKFRYEARSESGQVIKDVIEAEDMRHANRALRELKLAVVSVKEIKGINKATGCTGSILLLVLLGIAATVSLLL